MALCRLMDLLEEFTNNSGDYRHQLLSIENFFRNIQKTNELEDMSILYDSDSALFERVAYIQRNTFKMAWKVVIGSISRGKNDSRAQALNSAVKLLQLQAAFLAPFNQNAYYFPSTMLQEILKELINSDMNNTQLISLFKEYTTYNDVLYYCWQVLPKISPKDTPNETFINNYIDILNTIPLRKDSNGKNDEKPKLFCEIKGGPKFRFDVAKTQRCMEKSWECMTNWNLNDTQMQKVLLLLLDHLIPHLPRPVLLTDFLMNAMDHGGAVSTLALQGVFNLMQQHNLEYPLVYTKLYSMYEPDLYTSNHKSRLYYLTDIFLSSTHLPEAMVAGFIKRFSRLAIKFPATDAIVLLHMIANLIVRHPGLGKMVATKDTSDAALLFDPYNYDETDPNLSGAIKSSLWEVAILKHHAFPTVASAAGFALSSHCAKMEKPIGEVLDETPDSLIEDELNRNYQQVFLTTTQSHSISGSSANSLNFYWDLFN